MHSGVQARCACRDKNGCKLNGEKSLGRICAGILCDPLTDIKFTLSCNDF